MFINVFKGICFYVNITLCYLGLFLHNHPRLYQNSLATCFSQNVIFELKKKGWNRHATFKEQIKLGRRDNATHSYTVCSLLGEDHLMGLNLSSVPTDYHRNLRWGFFCVCEKKKTHPGSLLDERFGIKLPLGSAARVIGLRSHEAMNDITLTLRKVGLPIWYLKKNTNLS